MIFNVKYSLREKKDSNNNSYLEISFTGDPDKLWMNLFKENIKDYNLVTELQGWDFLHIKIRENKWIIRGEEKDPDYSSNSKFLKTQNEAMSIVMSRTNIHRNKLLKKGEKDDIEYRGL